MVLFKKVLGLLGKPQFSVCGKGNSGKRRKRNTPAEALSKPVVADFFNQRRLQQRLAANKIQNHGLRAAVDEIRSILFVQVKQIVNDLSTRFDTHVLSTFVVLIAI